MAQSQRAADVHQDELRPPNKRYALMDANKKVDLENPFPAEQKSREELEAKQNMEKVKENLMDEEIKKLVEGSKNVQENVEVENIAEISQPVNVIEEEEESAYDDYELKRKEKGNHVEEIRNTPSPITIRSPRIQSTLVPSDTEKHQELTKTDPTPSSSLPSSSSPKTKLSNTN
ncbi:hypothetical protein Tco_0661338, partial [Tanacetum coccineum]